MERELRILKGKSDSISFTFRRDCFEHFLLAERRKKSNFLPFRDHLFPLVCFYRV